MPLTGLRRVVALYAAMVRAELQSVAAYRWQLFLGVLSWVVPLAFMALWRGAAAQGPVNGITATQFTTYFCLLLVTTNLQMIMPVIFTFGWAVYSGRMSTLLIRPCHAVHQVVAMGIAEKVYALPVVLVLVPVVLAVAGGSVVAGGFGWVVGLLTTLLGTVATVYLAAMSGAIAFWMTKAQGIQGLVVGAEWILGGIIAPVALLPAPWSQILRHQPLWYSDAAAPEILSGISEPSLWIVVEAAAWVVALHVLYRRLWRRAVLRYEAVGT